MNLSHVTALRAEPRNSCLTFAEELVTSSKCRICTHFIRHSAILRLFMALFILFPWLWNKKSSLQTTRTRIPFWAFCSLPLNMSLCASAGAVSLKSMTLASWRLLLYTNIIPPPPIPDECILTTPKQNMAAMAASTAEPLASRMSLPIWEHWGVSVATASLL